MLKGRPQFIREIYPHT